MKIAFLLYGVTTDNAKLSPKMISLQTQLDKLNKDNQAEVVYFVDNGEASIEEKKEWLLTQTKATKYAFIDVDTEIDDYYILKRLNAVKLNYSIEKMLEMNIYSKINITQI